MGSPSSNAIPEGFLAPAKMQMVLVAGIAEHAWLPGKIGSWQADLARPPGCGEANGFGGQVPGGL